MTRQDRSVPSVSSTSGVVLTDLKQEGLFRKSGNLDRQRLLRDRLNGGEEVNQRGNEYTAHDCANILKAFLGEIPEPLMMEKHYTAHCQISG